MKDVTQKSAGQMRTLRFKVTDAAEPVGQMPFKLPVRTDTSPDGVMFVVDAAREILILDVRAHYADAIVTALNSLPTLQSDLAQAQRCLELKYEQMAAIEKALNIAGATDRTICSEIARLRDVERAVCLHGKVHPSLDKLQADLTEARAKVANLTADRDQLQMDLKLACNLATEAMALLTRYASECAECGGKGWFYVGEGVSGRGPDDVDPEQEHCSECADIRAFLAKAKGAV